MENKIENKMCDRCTSDYAKWWMEEFDEMWCADCRDAYTEGLFTYKKKNKIENTGLERDPNILKRHIKKEIADYYAMCIDRNDLENTFEQAEFEEWLEENNMGYYESYTIYQKQKVRKEESQEE